MHDAFKVTNQLDEAGVKRLAGYGFDVEQWSGSDHHKVAIPAMFLIDTKGTIRFAHADPHYSARPPVAEVAARVRQVLETGRAPVP